MDKLNVQQYAEVGARIRLTELDAERQRILALFPALANGNGTAAVSAPEVAPTPAPVFPRHGRRIHAAERAQISKRMRAYWRKKRAEKAAAAAAVTS